MDIVESSTISVRVRAILRAIPPGVTVVAAAKGAAPGQITEAVEAGIRVIGHNHVVEARQTRGVIVPPTQLHFIGRLRPHSVRAATLALFDAVQSVDSLEVATEMERVCTNLGRPMPVFIEINSGREDRKGGVLPEAAESLIRGIAGMQYLRVQGLMTLGPVSLTRSGYRACFALTRQLFEYIGHLDIPGVQMEHLSMGMSDSYEVAIEEGATMVRLGTVLFGAR